MSNSSSSESDGHSQGIDYDDNITYNGKRYVITCNNPNNNVRTMIPGQFGEEINKCLTTGTATNRLTYAVWSTERGITGTLHYQCYIECEKKVKASAMKNKLAPLKVWVKPAAAKSTAQHNIDYISHTGKWSNKAGGLINGPFFIGVTPTGQGTRTDINDLAVALKSGKTMVSIAEEHTNTLLKCFGNASKMKILFDSSKVRTWMTELFIYTGKAGSGKSHAAYEEAKQFLLDAGSDELPYMLMIPNKGESLWWEGYEGQQVVIIDDFYGTIDINYFKRMVDKYPMKVNIKNMSAQFLARRVYVTSNQGWKSWWGSELLANSENVNAIQRRITKEKVFDTVYNSSKDVVEVLDAPVRSGAIIANNINDMFAPVSDRDWVTDVFNAGAQNDMRLNRQLSTVNESPVFNFTADEHKEWNDFLDL